MFRGIFDLMVKKIKNTLLPTKHNDYIPHIMREWGILFLVVVILVVFIIGQSPAFYLGYDQAAVLPSVLVDLTNNERYSNGLGELAINPLLTASAQAKANDMARNGYFAHTSPTGESPWFWFSQIGYSYRSAGENLAVGFFESEDVETAWMNSLTHRANILSSKYSEIGIAVAKGTYQGVDVVFVVQHFGRPLILPSGGIPALIEGDAPMIVPTPEISPEPIAVLGGVEVDPTTKPVDLNEAGREVILAMVNFKHESQSFVEVDAPENFVGESEAVVLGNTQNYSSIIARLKANPSSLIGFIYFIIGLMLILIIKLIFMSEPQKDRFKYATYGFMALLLINIFWFLSSLGLATNVIV